MMNLRTVVLTFGAIFLAELGDKTQLAVVSFTASEQGRPGSRLSVLVGACLGLIASTVLAVAVGEALLRVVRPAWLQLGAAVVFVLVGALVGAEALRDLRRD